MTMLINIGAQTGYWKFLSSSLAIYLRREFTIASLAWVWHIDDYRSLWQSPVCSCLSTCLNHDVFRLLRNHAHTTW